MKTILRTTCAIFWTFVVIASVHADTFGTGTASSVTNTPSDLSSISLRISWKLYTGEEVKNRIISNIFTIESTKKTLSEKDLFIHSILRKIIKMQNAYSELPKWENKKNILKVLYSVNVILYTEDRKLENSIYQESLESNTTSYSRPAVIVDYNIERDYHDMLAMAKTQDQTFYVNVNYGTIKSMPSIGWKDRETAINYQLQSHRQSLEMYPKTTRAIIIQAVDDALAKRVGTQYLEEAFKRLQDTFENN